ncbi:helix-turn-helix domain-containing protein [Rhodobacterales bacterium LSUCC1028]|nr:helix-turn-helix domain-containing protein [Rhodobacterales bacterium LSUCC1028]
MALKSTGLSKGWFLWTSRQPRSRSKVLNRCRQCRVILTPGYSAEICQYAGISSRQLERLFKRYLNTTPKKHLLGVRLAKARQLLQQTEMSVTEITLACGFENTSHFARLYRRAFGIAPREQRAI